MPRWGGERRARPLPFLRSRRPRSSRSGKTGERARAASLVDAARWCASRRSASLLSREEFFERCFLAWLSWRRQSSGAKAHHENESACLSSPASVGQEREAPPRTRAGGGVIS